MRTFNESRLAFTFSKRWKVLKYDEHRFYRYSSGSGFKGVDFIGILDKKKLTLIEVKNCKDRYLLDDSDPSVELVSDPIFYAQKYVRKFKDTFQLIAIIRKYYKRKWWFKTLIKWFLKFIPRRILQYLDWGFWNVVIQVIDEKKEKILIVLWLELNDELPVSKVKIATTQIQQYLQSQFKKTEIEIILTNSKESILGFEGKF